MTQARIYAASSCALATTYFLASSSSRHWLVFDAAMAGPPYLSLAAQLGMVSDNSRADTRRLGCRDCHLVETPGRTWRLLVLLDSCPHLVSQRHRPLYPRQYMATPFSHALLSSSRRCSRNLDHQHYPLSSGDIAC